jgi:hypothetical protein
MANTDPREQQPDLEWLKFISTTPDPVHRPNALGLLWQVGGGKLACSLLVTTVTLVLAGWIFSVGNEYENHRYEFDSNQVDSVVYGHPATAREDWAEEYLRQLVQRTSDTVVTEP